MKKRAVCDLFVKYNRFSRFNRLVFQLSERRELNEKHVFPLSITLLTLVAWIIALPHLPATMPIHWGANGEADGFATKINAMILTVGIMVLIYFVIAFVPRIDPRKENYKYFSKTYNILLNAVLLLFFFVNMSTILQGLGYNVPMSYIAPIMAGLVLSLSETTCSACALTILWGFVHRGH